MRKKKILHILAIMPIGGVGAYLKNISSRIDKEQFEFSYVVCDENKEGDFAEYVSAQGEVLYNAHNLRISNYLSLRQWFNDFFCKHQFDLVEIHSPNIACLCAHYAKKCGKAKVIIHFHSTMYASTFLKSIRNYILTIPMKKWANHYITCGQSVADKMLIKRKISKEKITVVENGIDIIPLTFHINEMMELKKRLQISEKKICLAVGNCFMSKNYSFLLDVFEKLAEENSDIVLIVAGGGPMLEELKENRDNRKLDNVLFLGYRKDIALLMNIADMLVMPSLYEGLPVVSIEAQLYGLPMLVSASVTKEIKINKNVHYLDLEFGVKKWAEEIKKIIEEPKEDGKALLGSKFDINCQVKLLSNTYMEILGE